MRSVIIIPARFASSRFPGKPLAKIYNKELILWVCEIAEKTLGKKNVYVATDSKKISNFLEKNNKQYIMTSKNCLTGTDRVAEASRSVKADIFINLQGDEPLVKPSDIKKIIHYKKLFFNQVICGYSNLIKNEDPKNINIPKIIFNKKNNLVYASRLPIPGYKEKIKQKKIMYYKQVCIYAFSKLELQKYYSLKKKSILEELEDIEFLRFFDLDIKIKMVKTKNTSLAVDEINDIKKIEKYLK